jgi:hypothetical protein
MGKQNKVLCTGTWGKQKCSVSPCVALPVVDLDFFFCMCETLEMAKL